MKLIIVIMTTFLMQVSAITYAQQITLREGSISLKKVFTEIRRQTGYTVLYRTDVINNTKPVNLDLNKVPLEDALKEILKGQNLDYVIKDKAIFVSKKEASFLENIIARFRAIDVRGRVVDAEGNALPGATVKVKGKKQLVTTNANGEFALLGVDENAVLTISYIGYQTKEVVAKSDFGAITMSLISNDLTEVVVNKGYYTTRKELETGNVSRVTAKEIGQQPISNPLQAMVGRVPGLIITQATGVPGGGFFVQVRGKNSINSGNDPLYIVDGVPYSSQMLPNIKDIGGGRNPTSKYQSDNPLNYINPSDIESIDVLKDADATSIYGSRGANGVVIITTKKGKAGEISINANVYGGVGKVSKFFNLMDTKQYLAMRREAFKNDKVTPTKDNAPDLMLWDTTRNTNWQKELLGGSAKYTDAQLNISGGNENTQYLIGGGYHRETAVFPGSNADQKASVHFNINSKSSNDKFKIQLSGNYVNDNSNLVSSDFTNIALLLPPDAPILYNPDGTLNWEPATPGAPGTWTNPLANLNQRYIGRTANLVSNTVLSYTILPKLDLKLTAGYNNLDSKEKSLFPTTSFDPGSPPYNSSNFSISSVNSWIIEPQINYGINIGKGVLAALIGSTFNQIHNEGQQFNAFGFSSDALISNPQAASTLAINPYSGGYTSTLYKYNALFGRLNYNWEDKYLVNVTVRRDGTSRFGPDKQFANFGAIGAAWVFSNEGFVKNGLPFLSFGKLRGSYGTTGNDQITDYSFMDLYGPTSYLYQNVPGLYPGNLFNSDLAWEFTKKIEAGIELGFLKDRIAVNANYYRNHSSNQLISYPLSSVTGFESIRENLPATVQNTGVELELHTVNIKTANFSWRTDLNLTVPRNKLVAYPDLSTSSFSTTYIIGQPITIQRLYKWGGVDPTTGKYRFIARDGNYTSNPTDQDRTVLADYRPKLYGGLQNSFQYKNFSFDFLFQFVKQKGISFLWNVFPGFNSANQLVYVTDHWQKTGDMAEFQYYTQGFSVSRGYQLSKASDLVYQDASFIRLKNASFSYSFDKDLAQKMQVKSLKIYIQGQNLLTFTKYKGPDPESQGGNQTLPALRVITAGIQAAF